MDRLEIDVGKASSRQCRKGFRAVRCCTVEPRDETHHLVRDSIGRRRLKVDFGRIRCPRDHLHGFAAGAIAANVAQILTARHHHPVPSEEHFSRERNRNTAVQADHQLRNTLLCRRDRAVFRSQSKLPLNRRLDTGPVQVLPFDLRGGEGLNAHLVDRELRQLRISKMLRGTD